MSGIDVYKLGQKTQRDKTNFEIERLQKELDNKDKVIDLMEKDIKRRFLFKDKEYYHKKVEEENENQNKK